MPRPMSTSSTETLLNSGYAEPPAAGGRARRPRRGGAPAPRLGRRALVPLLLLLLLAGRRVGRLDPPEHARLPGPGLARLPPDLGRRRAVAEHPRSRCGGWASAWRSASASAPLLGIVAGPRAPARRSSTGRCRCCARCPSWGSCRCSIVWLGIGEGVKIGLVVIGVIFPIYLNLHKGIRAVDPRFAELAQACGVGRRGVIRQIIMPGCAAVLPRRPALRARHRLAVARGERDGQRRPAASAT